MPGRPLCWWISIVRQGSSSFIVSVEGEFETISQNKNKGTMTTKFIVIVHLENPPFIGRDTPIELSLIILELTWNLKEKMSSKSREYEKLRIDERNTEEIRWRFRRNMYHKELTIGKTIDERRKIETGENPIAQKPRSLPYHLEKQRKVGGIFEKVLRNVGAHT